MSARPHFGASLSGLRGRAVMAATARRSSRPPADDIRDIRAPIAIPSGGAGWCAAAICGAGGRSALPLRSVVGGAAERAARSRATERARSRRLEARARAGRRRVSRCSSRARDAVRAYSRSASGCARLTARRQSSCATALADESAARGASRARLRDFLELCDLAKFARWSLAVDEDARMLRRERARALRRETTRRAPPHGRPS